MRVTTVDDRCRLFFRLFFDDFEFLDFSEKCYWARCFGKRFGSSEGVRGGLLGIRGGSRRPLGGSWGGPGGVRGASWESLGLPLLPQRPRNKTPGETFSPPRLTETLPKFTLFFFSFFAPSWLPLGLVLAPSWAPSWLPLGLHFGSTSAQVASGHLTFSKT